MQNIITYLDYGTLYLIVPSLVTDSKHTMASSGNHSSDLLSHYVHIGLSICMCIKVNRNQKEHSEMKALTSFFKGDQSRRK